MRKIPLWLWLVEFGVLFLFAVGPLQFIFGGSNLFIKIAKDVLFFLPAYCILVYSGGGYRWLVANGALSLSMVPFVMLTLGKSLFSGTDNLLAVLIGIKCWLFYIPLLYIGTLAKRFWFGGDPHGNRFLKIVSRLFLIGNLSIIVQSIMVAMGLEYYAYMLYGDLAQSVTQEFAVTGDADFSVIRNPGLYIFTLQAGGFVLGSIFFHYGIRHKASNCVPQTELFAGLFVSILAGVLLGARMMYLLLPIIVLCCEFTVGRKMARKVFFSTVFILVFATAISILLAFRAASVANMIDHLKELVSYYFVEKSEYNVIRQSSAAGSEFVYGEGIGAATGPARFAGADSSYGPQVLGIESYFGKARVEMGLAAPWFLALFWAGIIVTLIARFSTLAGWDRREITLALFGVLTVIGLSIKGSSLDYDPVNVFFWLGVGVVLGELASRRHDYMNRRPPANNRAHAFSLRR